MNQHLPKTASHPVDIFSQQIKQTPAQRQHARQANNQSLQRKYEIMYLDADQRFNEYTTIARCHPAFEDAFSALTHGATVQTHNGYMSAEDVLPGEEVRLADGRFEKLLWRGRITITPPDDGSETATTTLTRLTADALGYGRPAHDLVLGPSARLLHKANGIRKFTGSDAAFIPAADFIDGNTVLSLRPNGPVSVFQFGFAGQRTLTVNGVDVETLHPGTAFNLGLRGDALREYLSLFPHKRSFEEFGLMDHPRLRMRDLELLA